MSNFKKDLKDSIKAVEANKEIIKYMLSANRIFKLENENGDLLSELDMSSGVDYMAKTKDGIVTVATRVQWRNAYDSFTVRYKRDSGAKTECEKRMDELIKGTLGPKYTLQMYCMDKETNKLLSIAVCKTEDLMLYIYRMDFKNDQKFPCKILNPVILTKRTSNASFLFVGWKSFVMSGFKVKIHRT